jgi:hypothetical protein
VAEELITPPINVLRLSLHPLGLARRIINMGEWRRHLLHRLRQQAQVTADPAISDLHDELQAYPCPEQTSSPGAGAVIPMVFRYRGRDLSFISTTTLFGAPFDVTVAELAIESFLPADAETRALLTGSAAMWASD